ncbi:MAG TPA: methionyl-tRNA formyltransferase [candidate division Zixibacteria bacterium]|nr:methionyl-tRNA formyltransferase [candidate division Zixibacteria bacterium]
MKIVYMGTPAFACPPLLALHKSRHDVLAVVTGQDKQIGRGRKVIPTNVASLADKLHIKTLKPASLKDETLCEQIKSLSPDLIVVIAFRILPKRLFSIPKLGAVNIHGSLLPKYRGAAPINWALINGEKETGLSAFYLNQKVDTGDIIFNEKITIENDDNFDSLYNKLSELSALFLLKTIEQIDSGTTAPVMQDESLASLAPKITPFDALIDFGFPAENVVNFVRGMSTTPGAYSFYKEKKIKILACEQVPEYHKSDIRHGTIIRSKKKLQVQCANSAVEITKVLPEGKKIMDGASFLNGFRPKIGEIFGELHKGNNITT